MLNLEEQFSLVSFGSIADQMSREQAIDMLKMYHEYALKLRATVRSVIHADFSSPLPSENDLGI